MSKEKLMLTPLILFACSASAENISTAEHALPALGCATTQAPKFCGWSKKAIMAAEQRIVERETKDFKEHIIPNLAGATWVPDDLFDKTNPQIKAYCSEKLAELQAGQGKYFPPPLAKSSEIGFRRAELQRKEEVLRTGCDKGREAYFMDGAGLTGYTEWFYSVPNALIRLNLNPGKGKISIEASLNQCNDTVVLRNKKVNAKELKPSPGFFTEQNIGLVEMDGDFFAMEGGKLIMGDSSIWRNDILSPLFADYYAGAYFQPVKPERYGYTTSVLKSKYKLSATQQKSYDKNGTWLGRIFVLYPLNPPWRDYYHQLKIPSDELPLGTSGQNPYSKPCMWNIPG